MSRAFVKEDAVVEAVLIPARPPLPADSPNLVTALGLTLLETEFADLQAQRQTLSQSRDGTELERVRQLSVLDGQLDILRERLASAQAVPQPKLPLNEVVFGVTVTAQVQTGKFAGEERRFTIVGVDEAETGEAKVAFSAPLARAVLGCKLGEEAQLEVAGKTQVLKIMALELA